MKEEPGMQQWHMGPRPLRAATPVKQGDILCGPRTDHGARVGSSVRIRKMSFKASWRSQPPLKRKKVILAA
jgi:hypothetical protein